MNRNAAAAAGVRLATAAADERVAEFVERVLERSCAGYDHSRIKLEQVLAGAQRSNLDAAIWSQGTCVYVAIDRSDYRCPQMCRVKLACDDVFVRSPALCTRRAAPLLRLPKRQFSPIPAVRA